MKKNYKRFKILSVDSRLFFNQYLKTRNSAALKVHRISIETDRLILYRKLSLFFNQTEHTNALYEHKCRIL
jgi:hypothetical protein